jgi:hypothetical protein
MKNTVMLTPFGSGRRENCHCSQSEHMEGCGMNHYGNRYIHKTNVLANNPKDAPSCLA